MLLLTLYAHWFVYYKQLESACLILRSLHNGLKPECCFTAFSETAEKFPECNWLPTNLQSSNAFTGIHKHKDRKWSR